MMSTASTLVLPNAPHPSSSLDHIGEKIPLHFRSDDRTLFLIPAAAAATSSDFPTKRVRIVQFDQSQNKEQEDPTEYDVQRRWISERRFLNTRLRSKKTASRVKESFPEYVEAIEYLMESYKGDKQEKAQEIPMHVTRVLRANCRGLERSIVSSIASSRRRQHRELLALQHRMKKDGLLGTQFGEDALRKLSLSHSQSLRQLAFRLGQADEWEASQIHKSP